MKYRTIVNSLLVLPEGEPAFSVAGTVVRLNDDGSGPFVVLEQVADDKRVVIERNDWPSIRAAIERMLQVCDELDGEHAIETGAQQAESEEAPMVWIPVEAGFPVDYDLVLLANTETGDVHEGYRAEGEWYWGKNMPASDTTHWLPWPKAPGVK